jgi:hypothetical protein
VIPCGESVDVSPVGAVVGGIGSDKDTAEMAASGVMTKVFPVCSGADLRMRISITKVEQRLF